MTDISVRTTDAQVEDRSWLIYQPGGSPAGLTESGVLDVSAFVAGTHYPNGFLRSGLVVGKITATGLYGPYDNTAVDGRQTAVGLLFSATKVPNPADTTVDVGAAILQAFATVKLSRLPIALDAAGQADLPRLHFIA